MKKQLLAGAASLVMATTPVLGVFATDINTTGGTTKDVKVGEVDDPVYSVDINWGDLVFDWKYNEETNEYNFLPKPRCVGSQAKNNTHIEYLHNNGELFSDNTCSTSVTGSLVDENYYYYFEHKSEIAIKDHTTNGRIEASATFTAESDYEWVAGKIGGWGTECMSSPAEEVIECHDFFTERSDGSFYYNSTQTDTDGSYRLLLGSLNLEKIPGMGNTAPITEGDKIGTVTIDITPDLN